MDVKTVGGRCGVSQWCLPRAALWPCRGARLAANRVRRRRATPRRPRGESRRDRQHRARGHQVVRQADRRRQHSVHAQRVQGSERQDRRLRRRPDERDRGHPRPDGGVPRGRLRQDHPVDPGRHLQRRHVVVHRHQGARADGRLRHLLLGGHPVGAAAGYAGSTRTTPAARRSRCRPPPPRRPRSCRPRARRAPTRASRRSRSCSSTGRTRRPTPWCSARPTRCRRTPR